MRPLSVAPGREPARQENAQQDAQNNAEDNDRKTEAARDAPPFPDCAYMRKCSPR